jgi:hypothetical protein
MRRRHFTRAGEIVIADVCFTSPYLLPFSNIIWALRVLARLLSATPSLSVRNSACKSYVTVANLGGSLHQVVDVVMGGSRKPLSAWSGRWGPTCVTL